MKPTPGESRKQAEKLTNDFELEMIEFAHWVGGWDELRKVIDRLEAEGQERAFERWSEDRYSIDGIAEHNSK